LKVLAFVLAQGVKENTDRTIDLWGAGVTEFRATGFPAINQVHLLARLELEPQDKERELHFFELRIVEGDREVVPWGRVPLVVGERDATGRAYVHIMSNLQFPTFAAGVGVIEAKFDGRPLPSLHYQTVLLGSDPPPPGTAPISRN
jgi:hypothetical protein